MSDVRVGGDTTPKHFLQHSHDCEDEDNKAPSAMASTAPASDAAVTVCDTPTVAEVAAFEDPSSRQTPPSSPHVGKER